MLDRYTPQIGYFTFWLSVFPLVLLIILSIDPNGFKLEMK